MAEANAAKTITITYEAPVAETPEKVAPICAMFEPHGSYVDTDAYEGTAYDTNVYGMDKFNYSNFLSTVSMHPGITIMFKAAMRDGEATVTETDPKVVEYYKDLGESLADSGFTVSVA